MIEHLKEEASAPERVVIVGASGFVGRDLVRHLTEQEVEAVALSSADVDLNSTESATKLRGIVREQDALVIVSAITPDKGKDVATLMRNLAMGQNVAAFLEEVKCRHIVYISSDAVYADDANPVRETSCCDPSSFHGLMHLVRERMFAASVQKGGVPYLILRPSAVYGAGDTHNSYGPNRFLRDALKEHKIKLFGQGEEKRDHVYIRDLSCLTGLCLSHGSRGVLNVATGNSVSFFELAEQIAALRGGDVNIEGSPRMNPVTHRHFDVSATYKAFPSFSYTSLQDGLRESMSGMAEG
ncbi:MAG: NAD(P)-dependent oxidoreductase [Acidobacteria bacterium]|nr:NAD(P)-dependent oxidoreductase [Acidobacteriota bacterium]